METRGWWTSFMNVYPWSPSRGSVMPKIFPWKQLRKGQSCTIHLCPLPAKGTEACWWLACSLCPECSLWELSPWSLWKDEMAGDTSGLWASVPFSVCLRSVRFPRSCVQRMRLLKNGEIRFVSFTKLEASVFLSLEHSPPNLHEPPAPAHVHTGWPRWRLTWH